VKDGKTLREQTLEIAIEYFAIYGLDTPFTIFRQSDIRDITKLMWIIANVTPYSLMLRAHSFKDTEQKIEKIEKEIAYSEGQFYLYSNVEIFKNVDLAKECNEKIVQLKKELSLLEIE